MSEIADAIRADAEAARAEIRAAGIKCPSCEVNMADLPKDHELALTGGLLGTAQCQAGKPASLREADYETIKTTGTVLLIDSYWRSIRAADAAMWPEGGAPMTGFVDLLTPTEDSPR